MGKVKFVGFTEEKPIFVHGNFTAGRKYEVLELMDGLDAYRVRDDHGLLMWENKSSFVQAGKKRGKFVKVWMGAEVHDEDIDELADIIQVVLDGLGITAAVEVGEK